MVSFLAVDEDTALDVVARTRLFTLAESLGAVESLIEHPARMTHASAAGSPLEARTPVRMVIETYAEAYSRLDAASVKRVFPSINERALSQSFSGMKSMLVHVLDEQFQSLTDSEAIVTCTWDVNFVPKVGVQQHDARKITIRLQKANNAWVVVERR